MAPAGIGPRPRLISSSFGPQRSVWNILWTGPLGDEDVGGVIRLAGGLSGDAGFRVLTVVRVPLVCVALS